MRFISRQAAVAPGHYDPATLKILILSTLKTGNTWVKHLCSAIYDLPVVFATPHKLDPAGMAERGPRWVAHSHFGYHPQIAKWAKQNGVVLITTYRHPADALLSLIRYLENCPEDFEFALHNLAGVPPEEMHSPRLRDAEGRDYSRQFQSHFGMTPEKLGYTGEFVKNFFPANLDISLSWLASGAAIGVRYEDLWRDPLTVLTELTEKIHPVSRERLERAIEQCDIGMLREVAGRPKFYRNGRLGDWTRELAPELVEIMRTTEPYPAVFARLGYTLDPHDPLLTAPARPTRYHNPFQHLTHFDNGVPVVPIIARLYQSVEPEMARRWQAVDSAAPGRSFYSWLNEPSTQDSHLGEDLPLISNLAAGIYKIRPEFGAVYPDLYGRDRLGYLLHFRSAQVQEEYRLAAAFTEPVLASLRHWANLPEDQRDRSPLFLSKLAAYIYRNRVDVQKLFPQLNGKDRAGFLLWLLLYAPQAYGLGPEYFKAVRDSFRQWADQPAGADYNRDGQLPPLTNLLVTIYKSRPDYRAAFPAILARSGREAFLGWFRENGLKEYGQLGWDFLTPPG